MSPILIGKIPAGRYTKPSMAETLHISFYEDNLPREVVMKRAKAVKSMIENLKTLL